MADVVLDANVIVALLYADVLPAERPKTAPPNLAAAVATMRSWFDNGEVRFLSRLANAALSRAAFALPS